MKNNYEVTVEVLDSRSSIPTLKINQMYVHSKYDPLKEARNWASQVKCGERDTVIILGLGLGYHVRALLEVMSTASKILVIEPLQQVWQYFTEHNPELRDNQRVNVIVETEPDELREKLKTYLITETASDEIVVLEHPGSVHTVPDQYVKIKETVIEALRWLRVQENTTLVFSIKWTHNLFENIWETHRSAGIITLRDVFKERPAIVVSAGPSLNKNLQQLRMAKGKAVIICVGTALRVLLKEGIIPDLVVTIDGGDPNAKHFSEIDYKDIPLVFYPTVHPEILKGSHTRNFVSTGLTGIDRWLNRHLESKGLLASGGSVANTAFDLAIQMGCNPIAVIGQDLAYTEGETHAKGTRQAEDPEFIGSKDQFYVEDVFGGKVLTDKVLNIYRLWFEEHIKRHPDRLYVDATEGGAKINGTKIMSLRNFIAQYVKEPLSVQKIIDEKRFSNNSSNLVHLIEVLKNASADLQKIKKEAKRGERLAQSLFKEHGKTNPDRKRVTALLRQMDQVDDSLKKMQESHGLIALIIQPLLLQVTRGEDAMPDDHETQTEMGKRVARLSIKLYGSLQAVCVEMDRVLQETLKKAPQGEQDDHAKSVSKL